MAAREPNVAWFDGRLVAFAEARVPIEDRGLQFGESLYEVVAVTRGRARLLAEHAERMRAGAELLDLAAGVPDAAGWSGLVDALQAREQLDEGLLIAQLTGGAAPRSHLPRVAPRPTFFAYLRAYRFPREADVARGISAITHADLRWERCDLKTTMLLPAVMAKRAAAARGAGEALLIGPDGSVREGASSNVFVVEQNRVVTPRQSSHLLPGLTRPLVATLARGAGLEVLDGDISVDRLRAADEAFVTSTTFTVMPLVALDDHPLGSGSAGPVARELGRRLRVELELD